MGVSSNGKTLVSKTRYPGSNPGAPALVSLKLDFGVTLPVN